MNEKNIWHYNKKSLVDGLCSAGVGKGDIVLSHVSLGRLGYPEEGRDIETVCRVLYESFMEVVGPEGTVLIPTYTYSIGRREIYDIENTPSTVGPFTEYFRKLPGAIRSRDPMLAMAGIGPKSKELLTDLPHTCYGADSVYDRMRKAGAKICNVGISLYWTTFRHHIEEMFAVPFRFKKVFTGYILDQEKMDYERWVYFAAPLINNCGPDGMRLDKKARLTGHCKCVPVGRSEVVCIDAQKYFDLGFEELSKDPWFTAQGPPCEIEEIIEMENKRTGGKSYQVNFHGNISMPEMIESMWYLPRDVVSDGIDASFKVFEQVGLIIHNFKTGTEFGASIVPEKWTCLEGYLETLDGDRVFSHSDNPLHVSSYSQAFDGIVTREELFRHLVVHPYIEEAVPYHSLLDIRDWGLCCSKKTKDSLNEDFYRVVIKTAFSFSTLKVGEMFIKGRSDDCIVFCTHLDHPSQANDGLTGVAVGIDVIHSILRSGNNKYSYLLIVLPGDIGLTAYLGKREELLPSIKGFIFLDMLGIEYPHLFEFISGENNEFSRCCIDVLNGIGEKIEKVGEDEGSYLNSSWPEDLRAGFPILSISRCGKDNDISGNYPYPEHHSDLDSLKLIDYNKMNETRDLILKLVDAFEKEN